MSDTPQPSAQIQVPASPAHIITQEGAKVLIGAAVCAGASQLVHSEQALLLVLPAGAVVANGAITAWQRITAWSVLKNLADKVSDDIAVVVEHKH